MAAWLGDNDITLLLPEDGLLIIGDMGALQALHEARSGNGGIAVSSRGIGKVLHRTDFGSFEAEIKSECSLTGETRGSLEACVGMSMAFTDAGDRFRRNVGRRVVQTARRALPPRWT